MIEYITKDLTTVTHGIVAHGCNCKGKMGAGVAKAIREKWPVAYEEYLDLLRHLYYNDISPLGVVGFVPVHRDFVSEIVVANMLTQLNYGREHIRYADPKAIKKATTLVVKRAVRDGLPVYMSKVGCNLGGLDWDTDVRPIIETIDAAHKCEIFICTN